MQTFSGKYIRNNNFLIVYEMWANNSKKTYYTPNMPKYPKYPKYAKTRTNKLWIFISIVMQQISTSFKNVFLCSRMNMQTHEIT